MTADQIEEWRRSFRQILEKQVDPKVLTAVLDDIKNGLIRIENGVLRIESKIAERNLTEPQKNLLIDRLRPLPKPNVTILVFNGNPEVLAFVGDVQDVLARIGWIPANTSPTIAFDPNSGRGMGVVVKSQGSHPAAADVLTASLGSLVSRSKPTPIRA